MIYKPVSSVNNSLSVSRMNDASMMISRSDIDLEKTKIMENNSNFGKLNSSKNKLVRSSQKLLEKIQMSKLFSKTSKFSNKQKRLLTKYLSKYLNVKFYFP